MTHTFIRLAFTGHRPDKLGGYKLPNPTHDAVHRALAHKIGAACDTFESIRLITGGAQGVDQMVAEMAFDMGLSYMVAAPCRQLDAKWPDPAKQRYQDICRNADPTLAAALAGDKVRREGVVYIHDGPYPGAWVMQARNEWMVDNADYLVAVWDGTSGGTANCVRYALTKWYGAPADIDIEGMKTALAKESITKIRWIRLC